MPDGLDVRWLAGSLRFPLAPAWSDLRRIGSRPRRWARALRLSSMAARARAAVPPDAWRLHAHFANDAAVLARHLSYATRVPYRVTAHAYDLFQDPFLLDENLRSADHVYTVSASNLAFLRARAQEGGWDPSRTSILRCGIDLEEFAFRDPPDPVLPARLFCPARLVPKKGHAVLLEAVRHLVSQGVEVRLDLAGDGPLESELRRHVARAGLGSRVELLGSIPVEEVRRRMAGSDAVVLASRIAEDGDRDGLPVVLIEALALGVPAVATRVSGIPELLAADTGRTVEPDRPDLLAAAIRDALEEGRPARIARARAGRARVEREFDIRLQVEELRPPPDRLPFRPTEETPP